MASSIRDIDKNLKQAAATEDLIFADVRETNAVIYGLPAPKTSFCRLPQALRGKMSPEIYYLQTNTSGARVRFLTNSPKLGVTMRITNTEGFPHMPYSGYAGLDCYAGQGQTERWVGARWPWTGEDTVNAAFELPGEWELITLFLPLYTGVAALSLGVAEGCAIAAPPAYENELPILFYGSSITQGGCASRAANSYPALVCRRMNCDFINLGFSGNAKGEAWMAEYIASLPMRAFVFDYDHNAPTPEHLEKTHLPFLQTILKAQPKLPVLLLSKPNPNLLGADAARREIVQKSFAWATQNGAMAACLDGDMLLGTMGRDSATVDGVHPNDLGFWRMAEAVEQALLKLLNPADAR